MAERPGDWTAPHPQSRSPHPASSRGLISSETLLITHPIRHAFPSFTSVLWSANLSITRHFLTTEPQLPLASLSVTSTTNTNWNVHCVLSRATAPHRSGGGGGDGLL